MRTDTITASSSSPVLTGEVSAQPTEGVFSSAPPDARSLLAGCPALLLPCPALTRRAKQDPRTSRFVRCPPSQSTAQPAARPLSPSSLRPQRSLPPLRTVPSLPLFPLRALRVQKPPIPTASVRKIPSLRASPLEPPKQPSTIPTSPHPSPHTFEPQAERGDHAHGYNHRFLSLSIFPEWPVPSGKSLSFPLSPPGPPQPRDDPHRHLPAPRPHPRPARRPDPLRALPQTARPHRPHQRHPTRGHQRRAPHPNPGRPPRPHQRHRQSRLHRWPGSPSRVLRAGIPLLQIPRRPRPRPIPHRRQKPSHPGKAPRNPPQSPGCSDALLFLPAPRGEVSRAA